MVGDSFRDFANQQSLYWGLSQSMGNAVLNQQNKGLLNTAHMVLPQINYYRLSFWKHNDMGMRQNLYITIHQHFLEE